MEGKPRNGKFIAEGKERNCFGRMHLTRKYMKLKNDKKPYSSANAAAAAAAADDDDDDDDVAGSCFIG